VEPTTEQVHEHGDKEFGEPDGKSNVEDDDTLTWGVVRSTGTLGLIASYFIISGSIALFIYLRWIGITPMLADTLEPLGEADRVTIRLNAGLVAEADLEPIDDE